MPRKPRPTTPSMMLGPLGSPNSPPQTPTTAAPVVNRKYAARHLPTWHHPSRSSLLEDSGIQPTGNPHEFSFTPSNRFAQLSPRTSSEDSESDEDEEHSESESESESESGSEGGKAMQAISNHGENDEEGEDDEDSEDEEEEDSDDDGESTDVDDDVPMSLHPRAPAPMHAPMPAPMSTPTFVPGPAPMAVDGNSEEESDDEEDEEDDDSDSEDESAVTPPTQETFHESHTAASTAAAIATATKANFTLEELSDFDPMDQDRTGAIAPSGFSSPASARSRSRAPAPKELPPGLTRKMRDLNCGLSSSSDEDSEEDVDEDEAAHREFVRTQRELRMRKRRSHGSSIGKRTISERSDSDHEDWTPLDPDAVGSSARRLRRRVGDRRSFIHLQFQDPPPPRIDELDEPESEVEGTFIFCDSGTLAQELPYYSIEIMEYSTPSP
ncbi:hypothetical protein CDEST_03582 [Colletotrichum destructivum]|uniref:Uncharacterized protein n=1 Tax=Colletotrichum destructivum TaxID=34406 RepID=A0AAX4I6M4_9PEZI|nr:hypothetical protein CDEST_03582 [Colletotrichum destructivum]